MESKQGCLHAFVREGYYGGRVERYRSGFDGPGLLNYGDFNSMYPKAMLGPMPTDLAFLRQGEIDLRRATSGWLGFVEAEVYVPDECYLPPLPCKHRGKLIFPTGRFGGVWSSVELSLLEQVGGRVEKYHRSVWFRGRPIFTDYITHWYGFRDKSKPGYDPALDAIAKLFLNSLYGKLGMNPEREKLWFFPTDEELEKHTMIPVGAPIFGTFSEVVHSEPPYIIPHIAAWVTAKARATLWTTMWGFLQQGYKLYYCDTDSIITDAPVSNSTTLGELKLECQVKRGKFVAPKMYFIELPSGELFVKAKGFSGGFGAKGLTEEEFDKLVSHREKVSISRMRKLREGMREQARFPAMKKLDKGLRKGVLDDKRVLLVDGNTRPHCMEDLQNV